MNSQQLESHVANLLVVDDTPDNLRLLSTMLSDKGYKVRAVINGEMALKAARSTPPDLILLDITMPQMNGYEVCQHLKADGKTSGIPVIFLSALDQVLDKVTAFAVGGVDYITKPFHLEEVLARVENQLTIQRLQKKLHEQNAQLQESEALEREKAQQLEQALQQLQQAQAQLIQSEKMSSLGLLVAGVAHEINNPVNFIYGNLGHADEYTQELLKLVQAYQTYYPDPPEAIAQQSEAMDLDFMVKDLSKLIESMKEGARRIRQIVLALRTFSRLDEAEVKAINIHDGIDSTLVILGNRLKPKLNYPKIEILRNYGSLPLVECYPGPLNQVFMNILSNAIDAIEIALKDGQQITPTISIHTDLIDETWVQIRIRDNGNGIPEAIKQQIFDPFFTTKPIGSGTGMGLAISYQIITDRHQGALSCSSQSGEGTEFVIEIPLKQKLRP